jgi:glycosyltransferase involved in cell wall biosynthesis
MKSKAKESSLVKDFNIHHIPNTKYTDFFKPQDILNSTKHFNLSVNKKFILFGAANISDQRKGLSYLLDALQLIPEEASDSIELLVFGKIKDDILTNIPFKVNHLSYLNSKKDIVNLYNVANCFVLPSLEDNLPNTIMESLACGTPVVGFNTGGIPEMIEHKKTGYLAEYKSAKDLADGIYWTLFEANNEVLAENSRQKVLNDFNQEKIAGLHKELYEKVLENSKHAE